MSSLISHFIGGRTEDGTGTRTGAVFNPSTGAEQGRVRFADAATLARTVDIATAAGKTWGRVSHAARQQVVFKMRELVMRDVDQLARSIGREHGKTLADAKGEALRALETLEFAVAAPQVTKGEYSRNVGGGIDAFSVREPVGVVACISPFNFPLMAPMMMGALAVATGNAVILKPSEKVPTSALEIAALWKEAGLPDGIWNVVQGDKEVVDAILEHPGIAAVAFVGSTAVGEYVFRKGTSTNKRVAAYTGGKNHMVVMPDADLKSAADAFVSAGYGSSSQRCMAVSLLLAVGEGTAERLRELIIPRVNALRVGAYDDPKADFGALISAESRASVVKAIDACVADGGELLTDGRSLQVPGHEGGFYLGPTLIDHVTTDMAFYKHEIFGPVRGIMRAANLDEAIAITNLHDYGNGAVIYTREGRSANRFVAEVEAGMIGVNVSVPVPVGYYNFGGFRRSRFGDAQMFGPEAARFYTKLKTVSQRWPESDTRVAEMSLAFAPNA